MYRENFPNSGPAHELYGPKDIRPRPGFQFGPMGFAPLHCSSPLSSHTKKTKTRSKNLSLLTSSKIPEFEIFGVEKKEQCIIVMASMEEPKAPEAAPQLSNPPPTTPLTQTQTPLPPTTTTTTKKRPLDSDSNSNYFKIRAVIRDLRPHFIQVLFSSSLNYHHPHFH